MTGRQTNLSKWFIPKLVEPEPIMGQLKGHHAKTKEEMKKLTERNLRDMANNPKKLRGIFFRCCVTELLH